MAENSSIEWTDHTFNPWHGCAKVSPGCSACYAEAGSRRNPAVLGVWGPNGTRVVASESKWKEPLRWDRAARREGVRRKVFCASIADVFEEREDLLEARGRLFFTMECTEGLDWLLLTKRPENVHRLAHLAINEAYMMGGVSLSEARILEDRGYFDAPLLYYRHMWIGASAEDNACVAERAGHLRGIPARLRFLSCEPLLEDISGALSDNLDGIHWVIVGGESHQSRGSARPLDLAWVERIVEVCRARGVPVFVKQMGSRPVAGGHGLTLLSRKGGDMGEWPESLRVREFPRVAGDEG